MNSKKKAAIAVLLSLMLAQNSAGFQPTPIEPVPQTAFRVVVVEEREAVIYDTFEAPTPPRERISVPAPTSIIKVKIKPTPVPATNSKTISGTGRSVKGLASYYCCTNGYPSGNYAAAGPQLRVAMGGGYSSNASQPWKGRIVTVCGSKGCARVKLVDWCQCYWKQSHEKVIDLYKGVFFNIGAERGIVTVSW